MKTYKIKTKEPIKIELNVGEYTPEANVNIFYQGKEYIYAYISYDTRTMDLDSLRHWVEETYYDLDFLSPAYVPCELKSSNFQKN